jgi:D-hexose-6-phosphate mutarotase
MGNFQACRNPTDEGQAVNRNTLSAPPTPFDAMRASDDTRDSSVGRAVMEPAIARLSGPCGPLIRLVHRTGASCEVFLLGATVASYRLSTGLEILYGARPLAGGVKAMDGGIPVIFPQYGLGGPAGLGEGPAPEGGDGAVAATNKASPSMPEHGFARLLPWEVRRSTPQCS